MPRTPLVGFLLAVASMREVCGAALVVCRTEPCASMCAALVEAGVGCASVDSAVSNSCGCSQCCAAASPPPPAPPPLPCAIEPCHRMCAGLVRLINASRGCDAVALAGAACACGACCTAATNSSGDYLFIGAAPAAGAATVTQQGRIRGNGRDEANHDDHAHDPFSEGRDELHSWLERIRTVNTDFVGFALFVCLPILVRLIGDALVEASCWLLARLCCCLCGARFNARWRGSTASDADGGLVDKSLVDKTRPLGLSLSEAMTDVSWPAAVAMNGTSHPTALFLATLKLGAWHFAQPIAFFLIAGASWHELNGLLRGLLRIVYVREWIYVVMTVIAALTSPACFLASPWVRGTRDRDKNPHFLTLMYILAPESFIASVLVRGEDGSSRQFYILMMLFDIIALIACLKAHAAGAPVALVISLAIISTPILAGPPYLYASAHGCCQH